MQAPDNFLSAIQIAITLAGFLNAAFAADSFAGPLVNWLVQDLGSRPIPVGVLNTLMVILVTIILSYFTLVLGELVPKRIAMKKTEGVAGHSGAVWQVATVFRPVIWLLSKSTNGVLRLLHIDPKADEEEVSEDEIRMMVDLGEERGTIEANEKELIDNIFEFNKHHCRGRNGPPHGHGHDLGRRPCGRNPAYDSRFRDVTLSGVRGGCR